MRKPVTATTALLLLVLVPSGVLAWLGLRSADSVDVSERGRLRTEVEAMRDRWLEDAPRLRAAVDARVQEVLDHHASYLKDQLPGQEPTGVAALLRRTRARISGAGLEVMDLRLLDATGRVVHPVPLLPTVDAPDTPPTREDLIAHLRETADRAYYGDGGEGAALAVWASAAARARSERLRALCDVEVARVRARVDPGGLIASREAARLDEAWSEVTLLSTGRPAVLLWTAAAAQGGVFRERMQRLVQRGGADAVPLTAEERRRIERQFARTAPPGPSADFEEYRAALPVGASLSLRVTPTSLRNQLALAIGPSAGIGPLRVLFEGLDSFDTFLQMSRPAAEEALRFHEAATSVVTIPLGRRVTARVHLIANRWRDAYEASRERRTYTYLGVVCLFLVTALGLFLIRRAIARERQARRMRDEFIANVTHEVRTPLTSVLLHSQLMADEATPDDKRRRHADVVQAQGRRLSALVDDMLDFARLERGTRTLESVPVDLGAACREAIAPYRVLAEQDGVDVTCEIQGEEVAAMADPAALARILGNLVGNAWKHGRPARGGGEGRIRISAREADPDLIAEVRDDGPGIPPAERERVFERFGRGRRSTRIEGSGIGLALSRDLAQAMGGSLTVEDDGAETIFRLRLPAVPALDWEE